jgi:acyl-coenzyme A thioesterase PaaI-like protein
MSALALYRRLAGKPMGRWLFSRLICFKAPYFSTIRPRITALEPGRCEAVIRDRRGVRNHIGSVHAIAMCNLAELVGGLMTDATIPASMRWIPKGMAVQYLKKAKGTLRATATPDIAVVEAEQGYELPVSVKVRDGDDDAVFHARITMWVSPKAAR